MDLPSLLLSSLVCRMAGLLYQSIQGQLRDQGHTEVGAIATCSGSNKMKAGQSLAVDLACTAGG